MEPIVTPGLVLKETRYKESDRIITILTPGLGVISASAQSSLRLKSKLFSACGLFCYSEFVLLPGRNMYTVREAESKNVFHGIASSIEGMSLAMYMAEMAAALSPTGEEAEKELRLLLNCLYMLSEKKADLRVIKAVFELRTMSECRSWYIAGAVARTTARPFIWTRRRAVCFVPPVHRKQGRLAIWMPGHCLPCGISALWKTRKFLHLKFRSGALQSLPLQRSSMP